MLRLQIGATTVRFAGEKSILSNLFHCPIRVRCSTTRSGYLDFTSAEHAYQWAKLQYLGMQSMAERLHRITKPKMAKNFANIVERQFRRGECYGQSICNEWSTHYAEKVLLHLVIRKAERRPWLRYLLSKYKKRTFWEATREGCGLTTEQAMNMNEEEFLKQAHGTNTFGGKILKEASRRLESQMRDTSLIDFAFFHKRGQRREENKI